MKYDKRSIGVKLIAYFALFALAILLLLWVLQTMFLQSFYVDMKTRDIQRVAENIGAAYNSGDYEAIVDRAAYDNSILVYVTDLNGKTIYTTDEHDAKKHRKDPPGRNGSPSSSPSSSFDRPLPANYTGFLEELLESGEGRICYVLGEESEGGTTLVCGLLLDGAALYISTPLDSVGSTVSILRTQLLYVTIVSLLLGLMIAFFIARRFAKPVAAITNQAGELAQGRFPESFDKGFCSELDELSDTLTYASSELKKVEGLRRELVANISHDLRTPLTMIKAYTEMIRDISGDDKEKREKHLAVIIAETDRLTNLVSDVLSLSAIQSGNETLRLENLNVSDAVLRALSHFEPIFAQEGYTLTTGIEPDQYIHADPAKIEQVLYNLIGNAMNYVGEDKTIIVQVLNQNHCVRVEVTDHGAGIEQEDLPYIWERYYKARTSRGKIGSGLGLSIVKSILELHGARFGVESKPGEGSTFWFELNK